MKTLLASLFACLSMTLAMATPPKGTAYANDVATTNIVDSTTEAQHTLNMFLCVFKKAIPADIVNAEPYIAIVRLADCGGAEGAGIQTLSVVSKRVDDSQPQISKGHFLLKLGDNYAPVTMFFHLLATESPSEKNLNGVFTLEMAGRLDGVLKMRGRIVANASGVSMVLNSDLYGQQEMFQLGLKTNGTGPRVVGMLRRSLALNGISQGSTTFRFTGGDLYFCRHVVKTDGTGVDAPATTNCFDRDKKNGIPLSVRYALYNAAGERVVPDASGIAVRDASGQYGYATYRSVEPSSLAHGSAVTRANGEGSYTVFRAPGTLEHVRVNNQGVDSINGGIEVDADVAGTSKNPVLKTFMYWDQQASNFRLVERLVCSSDVIADCEWEALPDNTIMSGPQLAQKYNATSLLVTLPDGTSTEMDLPDSGVPTVRRDIVTAVGPGANNIGGVTGLVCLRNCPDLDAMQVATDIGSILSKNQASYRWDVSTLSVRDESDRALVADSPNLDALGVSAITSGEMLSVEDYKLAMAKCKPKDPDTACTADELLAYAPPQYYRWTMPLPVASRPAFLKSDGTFIDVLTAPKKVKYKMPATSKYPVNWTVELQLDTLNGLVGFDERCESGLEKIGLNDLCMPRFTIADGEDGYVTQEDGSILWVRGLDRELLLMPVAVADTAADLTLDLTGDMLPTLPGLADKDSRDPSEPSNETYAGAPPTEAYLHATAASVVDGKRVTAGSVAK